MTSTEDRFWAKVDVRDWQDCWLWQAAVLPSGYGRFGVNGYAHRYVYELLIGPIPEGLEIDHVAAWGCGNPGCVNPLHLEAVTHQENMLRGQTVAAASAAKTHCPRHHPYDEANTMTVAGKRRCRECNRVACRQQYLKRRARAVD